MAAIRQTPQDLSRLRKQRDWTRIAGLPDEACWLYMRSPVRRKDCQKKTRILIRSGSNGETKQGRTQRACEKSG